jgi:CheY-like chemotaxis protein
MNMKEEGQRSMKNQKAAAILLAEDDAGHALLIKKHLHRGGINHTIIVLNDGRKVVDYLFKEGAYATDTHAPPLLILLDLNLPVLTGEQVLRIIKGDARTKQIPVVVLTTTDNPKEIARCYDLGCDEYINKPVGFKNFGGAVRTIGLFLGIESIPEQE